MPKQSRTGYPPEKKRQAVGLVNDGMHSCAEVDRLLGLPRGTTAEWVKRVQQDGEQAFPGHGRRKADEAYVHRLEQELKVVREENEILKKVMGILAQAKPSALP
jgi:transposase